MVGLSRKRVFPKTKVDSITGQDRAQKHCDFIFSQIEKKSKVAVLQLTFRHCEWGRISVPKSGDREPWASGRVSAGLKFTLDILSKQPQYCSDIWNFFRNFFNSHFYHHKQKLPSALLILKPGVVLLPFRMVSAA